MRPALQMLLKDLSQGYQIASKCTLKDHTLLGDIAVPRVNYIRYKETTRKLTFTYSSSTNSRAVCMM